VTFSSGGAGVEQGAGDLTPSNHSLSLPEASKTGVLEALELCERLQWFAFHCISACSAYVPQGPHAPSMPEES